MHRPARVLIIDDHPVVREGLAARIERQPDLEVCGEAADIPDAVQLIESAHPDVAVIDVALKTGSGIDLIRQIKEKHPTVRMLVWSMYQDDLYAERALRAGALGYINKEHATSRIIDAIRSVLNGRIYLSEQAADQILQSTVSGRSGTASSPVQALSNRELEVFELIGQGLATAAIANRLGVSVNTIETHRQRIKAKFNLKSATELTRAATQWVLENG